MQRIRPSAESPERESMRTAIRSFMGLNGSGRVAEIDLVYRTKRRQEMRVRHHAAFIPDGREYVPLNPSKPIPYPLHTSNFIGTDRTVDAYPRTTSREVGPENPYLDRDYAELMIRSSYSDSEQRKEAMKVFNQERKKAKKRSRTRKAA